VDLPSLTQDWFRQGIRGVLVEGGAITLGHFFESGLWDRLVIYQAPCVLGEGKSWLAGPAAATMAEVRRLRMIDLKRLGQDVRMTFERGL
jgi:diaminohydroxyphosphoribosylaminopyrimidine deaminase/5-amino-6-(5-phosphoribosylamino)uracil reductase